MTILNFFLINLFVGVLCDQFLEAKQKSDSPLKFFLNDSEKKWIEYQQLLVLVRPKKKQKPNEIEEEKKQIDIIKNKMKAMISSNYFEVFMTLCILGNIITLGIDYEGESEDYEKSLEAANYFFTGVFILEACIKIFSFGMKSYFSTFWNIFDFFIVVSSVSELILSRVLLGNYYLLRITPQIIRIFRILRVLRIIKLIKRLGTLKKIIGTLISALPAIGYIGLLYLIVIYIFAILGVILFKNVTEGEQIDDYNNFSNVGSAMVLCFKMITGENWWSVMFDCYKLPPYCEAEKSCGHCNFSFHSYN